MVKEEQISSKFFSLKDVEKSYGEGNAKVKVLYGITTVSFDGYPTFRMMFYRLEY
jgi:hypothetical protein